MRILFLVNHAVHNSLILFAVRELIISGIKILDDGEFWNNLFPLCTTQNNFSEINMHIVLLIK